MYQGDVSSYVKNVDLIAVKHSITIWNIKGK
jgi:hypothetical protein